MVRVRVLVRVRVRTRIRFPASTVWERWRTRHLRSRDKAGDPDGITGMILLRIQLCFW